MSIIKVQKKGQVTLPTAVRESVGIADGDFLEVKLHRGTVVLTPKVVIDRSKFSTAEKEYSPAQRRVIDARLAKAEKDSFHGPFDTASEAISFLRKEVKTRKAKRKTR